MNPLEIIDYITGKKYLDKVKEEPFRSDENTFNDIIRIFSKGVFVEDNIKATDNYKVFYENEPDIARLVPDDRKEEYFYAMKIEQCSSAIPAKYLFLLKKCYETYGTLNNLGLVLPKSNLKVLFSEGTISEGYTLEQIIKSLVDKSYSPFRKGSYKNEVGDFVEVYLEKVNRVAILPKDIADKLTDEDIKQIEVKKGALTLAGVNILKTGKYVGVCDRVYNLKCLL